jgi:hypothetical protein
MSGSNEKIDGSDYHVRERCAAKTWMMYCVGVRYIYIGEAPRNPRGARLRQGLAIRPPREPV